MKIHLLVKMLTNIQVILYIKKIKLSILCMILPEYLVLLMFLCDLHKFQKLIKLVSMD